MRYALTYRLDESWASVDTIIIETDQTKEEDSWYDLCGDLYDYERERIEERLPADTEIQDVCATCFHKLVAEEWESQ